MTLNREKVQQESMFVTKLRNQLKEFGFTYRKAKQKPSLTHKQKKVKLMLGKEKQP